MEKNGKKAVVIGMAKSGIASAKLLYELGYDVTVNDMKTDIKGLKEELSGIEYKDALGVDHARGCKGRGSCCIKSGGAHIQPLC